MNHSKFAQNTNDSSGSRVERLPIRDLVSDQRFQVERLDQRKINSIVKNFDSNKIGVLNVSHRKGTYYVYDGQHRLAALKALFPNGDYYVFCHIRQDLNYKSEARLFATQNDGKTPVNAYHKYIGLLEAEDTAIVEIESVLHGLRLKVGTQTEKNSIACIHKLLTVHKQHTLFDFQNIMLLIKKTWDGETASLNGKIIGGVTLFYDVYKGDFDTKKFIQSLGAVSAAKILRDGDTDASARGELKYAKVILAQYNHKKREKLPYKFNG